MHQSRTPEGGGPRHEAGRRHLLSGSLSRRQFLAHVAVWAGGGLLAGPLATARAGVKPNIILLTADSLRADHMGAYGYARPTTPHLDRLAAESVLFEYAFAPASYTGPSLASLHTGKYPQEHFMELNNGDALYRHTDPTLAEVLKTHGYQTAAFVSNFVLERRRSQMDKGFTQYDDTLPDKRGRHGVISRRYAPRTTAAVLQWLMTRARPPFFLWVHYMEPHGPYAPPPPYDTMFVGDPLYRAEPRLLELSPEQLAGGVVAKHPLEGETKVTPRVVSNLLVAERDAEGKILRYNPRIADHIARYDGEIRSLDEAIGQVLQALKTRALYDTSWLLFSSDHGESLGEGGFFFQHHRRVTLEALRVPLLIKPSGKPVPRRVGTQVSLINLMPTLLEAVGSKIPKGVLGQSILPLLRGEPPKEARLVFSEIGSQYSLIDDRYQVLVGYDRPSFAEKKLKRLHVRSDTLPTSLFAYREDPLGQKDLSKTHHAAAEARLRELRAFLQAYRQRAAQVTRVPRPPIPESARSREILKQLGY